MVTHVHLAATTTKLRYVTQKEVTRFSKRTRNGILIRANSSLENMVRNILESEWTRRSSKKKQTRTRWRNISIYISGALTNARFGRTKSRNYNRVCKEPRTHDQIEWWMISRVSLMSTNWKIRKREAKEATKNNNEKSTSAFMAKNVFFFIFDFFGINMGNGSKACFLSANRCGIYLCDYALESQSLALPFSIQTLFMRITNRMEKAT